MIHDQPRSGIPVLAALKVLRDARAPGQIVVTNQGSARLWPQLATSPLDFHYNPSTMGGAVPLALGLALAQPQREVLVVSGDGALLMSLGALVTVAAAGAANLTIVVLENGRYEVTGGQKTPAAIAPATDLAGIARACGLPTAVRFRELADWQSRALAVLSSPGPRFVSLLVEPAPPEYLRAATPPISQQLAALRGALGAA